MRVPEVGALVEVVVSGRVSEAGDDGFFVQVSADLLLGVESWTARFPARTMFVTVAPPLPVRTEVALLNCGDVVQATKGIAPGDMRVCPRCERAATVRHLSTVEWPTETTSKARCAELPG